MDKRLKILNSRKSRNFDKCDIRKKRNIDIPFHKFSTPQINKLARQLDFTLINRVYNKLDYIIKLGKE